ncbi:MAG TPA: 2-amino-4-hydroxy-6-hydroxymethyldihydropteridine diphosphokinase [Gammaproteobacteria bacterium]|nr:2-amino-4-hydroxy-6-hydroxymethyldihydropteridine diphosphokinase [Gammaproteobacteria bacterium]
MHRDAVDAWIGLGSNLENPKRQLAQAVSALGGLNQCRVLDRSRLYLSSPMGPQDQPDFINAVVKLSTRLTAHELLQALQDIEQSQGRQRNGQHWGPRTIDLDILLYGDQMIDSEDLTVPHPGLSHRAFVLYPLWELDADLLVPTADKPLSLQALITDLQQQDTQLHCQPLEESM